MNKYLLLLFVLLVVGCSDGDESPTNAEVMSGVTDIDETKYKVPSTPQADIPSVSIKGWQNMQPGTIVEVFDAPPLSHLDGAGKALFVRYTSTDVQGNPSLASGVVLFPENQIYSKGELPLVVYGHMTTGAADACAPSHSSPDSTELQKMQQGDEVARRLLALGAVIARPDYEGLGEAGPHPYLRGDSLARSMRDMASAVATHWEEIGDRWVAAGHSEGATAALNTGNRMHPDARGMNLIGISAITPVTRLENLILLAEPLPVTGPGIKEAVALAALVAHGIATIDPAFKRLLLEEGGLSERALELWPDIERLCLADLSRDESWGGLPPNQLKGPRGDELATELRRALAADDLRHLALRHDVPIRIDAGILDLVAHLPYTELLVQTYRDSGYTVTFQRWLAAHSPTADMAAPDIAHWIMDKF